MCQRTQRRSKGRGFEGCDSGLVRLCYDTPQAHALGPRRSHRRCVASSIGQGSRLDRLSLADAHVARAALQVAAHLHGHRMRGLDTGLQHLEAHLSCLRRQRRAGLFVGLAVGADTGVGRLVRRLGPLRKLQQRERNRSDEQMHEHASRRQAVSRNGRRAMMS